jgi:hypothetical protein
MSVLAASRDLPLFVHVLGAMILVGGVVTSAATLAFARGEERILRLGYWSLLAVGLPGYILMRVGAQWIYSREGWEDLPEEPSWIGIGFIVADLGALLLLIALVAGGFGIRRLRNGGGTRLLQVTMAISLLLLVMYVVAVWAMGAKPD